MWIYERETLAFLEVNDAALRRYGYSRKEFLDMTLRDIRPAEDVPELLRRTKNAGLAGESTGDLWRHRAKDGAIFPVAITSWKFTYRGKKAKLILARQEDPSKIRSGFHNYDDHPKNAAATPKVSMKP